VEGRGKRLAGLGRAGKRKKERRWAGPKERKRKKKKCI
jgi:hypothetical protein